MVDKKPETNNVNPLTAERQDFEAKMAAATETRQAQVATVAGKRVQIEDPKRSGRVVTPVEDIESVV